MAESNFSLKDQLFNVETVGWLANQFRGSLDPDAFAAEVMEKLLDLELKQRITWIAEVMERHLPSDFPAAADAIEAALPPPLDPSKTDDDFGEFIIAPLGEYVARNGLADADVPRALSCLHAITQRFSMEFAIRFFLRDWPELTGKTLEAWAKDDNYHVRRLASEGTRPRLPWAPRVNVDEGLRNRLLDHLHADQTRYVTRSVANHLNDIAKDDPARVLAMLKRWKKAKRQNPKELDWMIRHALRTLVKDGDPLAMALLGYPRNPPVEVGLNLSRHKVGIDDVLEFTVTLTATADTKVLADYAMHFVKANGQTAPKIFKLKDVTLKAGQTVEIVKRHRFKGNATTFRLYPGDTRLVLQLNGDPGPEATVRLTA